MSLIQRRPAEAGVNLLSLPREIRDLIYTALLHIPNNTPASPKRQGPNFQVACMFYSVERYPEAVYAPLLRCSRQISDEFREVLYARQPPRDFRLDCMIKGHYAWPTWIVRPCPGTRVMDVLNIDVRFFNDRDGHRQSLGTGRCFERPFPIEIVPMVARHTLRVKCDTSLECIQRFCSFPIAKKDH